VKRRKEEKEVDARVNVENGRGVKVRKSKIWEEYGGGVRQYD